MNLVNCLEKFNCKDGLEEKFIKQILKNASNGNTKIYLLKQHDLYIGFIALSVSRIANFPAVLIDYLYIQGSFRKKTMNELGNIKLSHYLIDFAINRALQVKKLVAVCFLLLQPAHDKLIPFYENLGFTLMQGTKDPWMGMALPNDE